LAGPPLGRGKRDGGPGQKIEKTGEKYTKIKKNGVTSGAFESSLECSRRSFQEILEYSGRIWNNPETSISLYTGSTNIPI
jgi:hypothetical protein